MKKLLSLALILLMLVAFAPCAAAAQEKLEIRSAADWNALAADCVLDRYSAGISVSLENDLDFSGERFEPIPLFAGYFEGNGHTLRGISFDGAASAYGVFRRILEGGEVKNLNVRAEFSLDESETAGGIAGSNAGTIRRCTFEGSVSALKCAGGIAGVNEETGAVLRCKTTAGEITAQHRAGGVCGENAGRIEHCENAAQVNTVPLGQVLPDRLDPTLSAEEIVSLTDLGGICGYSEGLILSCKNNAAVGYLHLGSNVGGVCGRSCGILKDCANTGTVLGKKDVGGILGQLDPDREWDFSQGSINELQQKLDTLKSDIDTLSDSASKAQEGLSAGTGALLSALSGAGAAAANFRTDVETWAKENAGASREALERFAEQGKEGIVSIPEKAKEIPEKVKEIPEKVGEIPEKIKEIPETLEEIRENGLPDSLKPQSPLSPFESAAPGELIGSLQNAKASLTALQGQLSDPSLIAQAEQVSSDLFEISEYLNGLVRGAGKKSTYRYLKDISLTGEDTVGMIEACENRGDTAGETNVGGVVGAISVDYSLESGEEEELDLPSMLSGGAKYLIFAAIESCKCESEVKALKNTAGGIVGKMDFGAAVGCVFGGEVRTDGSFAGGIAGRSNGALRGCAARANLSAEKYLGGVAGQGRDLHSCLALPYFESSAQYLGSIAGTADGSISQNYYSGSAFGGIDGFSFAGSTEALEYGELLKKSGAEIFRTVRVRYLCEGETVAETELPYGETIGEAPLMPEREGYRFRWDELPAEPVTHSLKIEGRYEKPIPTLATPEETPELLCEGAFEPGMTLELQKIAPPEGAPAEADCAYQASIEGYPGDLRLHLRLPGKSKTSEILQIGEDGALTALPSEAEGSYLVFTVKNGGRFCVREKRESPLGWILPAAIGALILSVAVLLAAYRRKCRRRPAAESAATEQKEESA